MKVNIGTCSRPTQVRHLNATLLVRYWSLRRPSLRASWKSIWFPLHTRQNPVHTMVRQRSRRARHQALHWSENLATALGAFHLLGSLPSRGITYDDARTTAEWLVLTDTGYPSLLGFHMSRHRALTYPCLDGPCLGVPCLGLPGRAEVVLRCVSPTSVGTS